MKPLQAPLSTLPTARHTPEDLRRLSARRHAIEPAPKRKRQPVATIPAPPDGAAVYTRAQVATVMGVSTRTVKRWVLDGAHGVRLTTLTVPKGAIAPAALCELLSAVNGVPVEVET